MRKIFEGIYVIFQKIYSKSAILTHFWSCDRHDLCDLTSRTCPDVVTQTWWHSDWWVRRKRFLKELMRFSKKLTKLAILTHFESRDQNDFGNLTSLPWPTVVTQIWSHSDLWISLTCGSGEEDFGRNLPDCHFDTLPVM